MLTILNYNENKVKEGTAKCILENSFGRPVEKMTFNQKLNGFEAFMRMNKRAKVKAIHISLNFHPDEKLNEQKLKDIAADYMDKIGFENQPYLVYQHYDAGHPHIHVVTTNIQLDGSRILLYNIGRNQSTKARLELEKKYNLVKAEGRQLKTNIEEIRRVAYGKTETRRSISNIVGKVVQSYYFTSLPEFNAVLRQFNIVADRGTEDSRVFKHRGLQYRILGKDGNKIGVPIKASLIANKPTIARLEKLYAGNERLRLPHKIRIAECIDSAFGRSRTLTKAAFIDILRKQDIYVVFRENETGRIYGITFVDNQTKAVFNGSDLGKPYAAKALTERLTGLDTGSARQIDAVNTIITDSNDNQSASIDAGHILKDLTEAKAFDFQSPDAAMRKKRRKRRRPL